MKRLILLLTAVVLSFSPVWGQDARARLQENPERYGGVHHSYEAPAVVTDTPAPKGYEPFYVSHYGRHGSRYMTSMNSVTRVSHLFDGLDSLGVLSAEGVALHEALKALEQSHEDQAGYLTLRARCRKAPWSLDWTNPGRTHPFRRSGSGCSSCRCPPVCASAAPASVCPRYSLA